MPGAFSEVDGWKSWPKIQWSKSYPLRLILQRKAFKTCPATASFQWASIFNDSIFSFSGSNVLSNWMAVWRDVTETFYVHVHHSQQQQQQQMKKKRERGKKRFEWFLWIMPVKKTMFPDWRAPKEKIDIILKIFAKNGFCVTWKKSCYDKHLVYYLYWEDQVQCDQMIGVKKLPKC